MTQANPLLPVYVAARAVIDYMDEYSGACTGALLQSLRNALVETDDLAIPDFLRRKQTGKAAPFTEAESLAHAHADAAGADDDDLIGGPASDDDDLIG